MADTAVGVWLFGGMSGDTVKCIGWPLVPEMCFIKAVHFKSVHQCEAPFHTQWLLPYLMEEKKKVWSVNRSRLFSSTVWGGDCAALYSVKSLPPQCLCALLSNHQLFSGYFLALSTHTGGTFTTRVITVTPCPGVECVCVFVWICLCVCECACECVFLVYVYVCVLHVQRNTVRMRFCVFVCLTESRGSSSGSSIWCVCACECVCMCVMVCVCVCVWCMCVCACKLVRYFFLRKRVGVAVCVFKSFEFQIVHNLRVRVLIQIVKSY